MAKARVRVRVRVSVTVNARARVRVMVRAGAKARSGAHCAPKSALPRSTRTVLLGLPRSCLTPSRIDELSECAGNMNRVLHVLLTWPVRVDPLAGPQAQGQGP